MHKQIKRVIALVMCAVMLCGYIPVSTGTVTAATVATPTEAGPNLVTAENHNGGFEAALESDDTKPKLWNTLGNSTKVQYSLQKLENGNTVLMHSVPDDITGSGYHMLYTEAIPVSQYQGKYLRLAVDAMAAAAGSKATFRLAFYNVADTINSYNDIGVANDGKSGFLEFEATTSWKTYSNSSSEYVAKQQFKVPSDANYARIFIYRPFTQKGTVFFDNISLYPICDPDTHTYEQGICSPAIFSQNSCQTIYYKRCDNCDFTRPVGQGGVGQSEGTVLGASNHSLKHVPMVAPTATATGTAEYWECSKCNEWYGDANGSIPIADRNDIVMAKKYSNLLENYNWSFEGSFENNAAEGWSYMRSGGGYAYSLSTEQKLTGNNSLKSVVDETVTGVQGMRSAMVPVAGLDAISVMLNVYGDTDTEVLIYFYDASKNETPNVEGEPKWYTVSPGRDWTLSSTKFTVPEDAWYAQIMLYRTNRFPGTLYFDDITIKEYHKDDAAKYPTELFESFDDGVNGRTGLPWGWTYYNDYSEPTADAVWFQVMDVKGKLPEGAPKTTPDGKNMMMFRHDSDSTRKRAVYTSYIDVSEMEAVYASLDFYGTSTIQIYIFFADEFFTDRSDSGWRPWTVASDNKDIWGQVSLTAAVPEGAKYARVLIMKNPKTEYFGTLYIDKVVMKETDPPKSADDAPPVPEMETHEWDTIANADHPRVYFDDVELRRIKKWAGDTEYAANGYAGKAFYEQLIEEADKYLAEKVYVKKWQNWTLEIDLEKDGWIDLSDHPNFWLAPAPGYATPHPYLTYVGLDIQERMQALSMAYAISGDKAYGERAVQYALDLSEWEYWAGVANVLHHNEIGVNSSISEQGTGYLMRGVACAYDMCYDLLSKEERKLIERAMIDKGIYPQDVTCQDRMSRGIDMDMMGATAVAIAAIINEDNKKELGKYLDRFVLYTEWVFDWYDKGHNEGFSYNENGIEQLFEGMLALNNVLGYEGLFEHHFVTETLPPFLEGFAESYGATYVGYSDSPYEVMFLITCCVLAQRGNTAAGYIMTLQLSAEQNLNIERLIYTNLQTKYIKQPYDDYRNVTVVDIMGIGSLRTGWQKDDKLLAIWSDDNLHMHNHYEANSIFLAMNGTWVIKDPGYGSIQADVAKTYYDTQYATNTIFVDNKAQTVKGYGRVSKVVDSELYGHILGQAPEAYGTYDGASVLDKFDRNAIMMNHDSESYYIIVDDLAAAKEHVYGWNMVHDSRSRVELDGQPFNFEGTTMGNHFAVMTGSLIVHYEFVGEPLEFSAPYFEKMGETFGPLFRANAKSAKNEQFMTVISVADEYDGITSIDATKTLTARSTKLTNNDPYGWSWSSSNDLGRVIALPLENSIGLNMFRAQQIGDWMSFAFEVEQSGEFYVSLMLGSWSQYAGKWQIYLDDQPIGDIYEPKSSINAPIQVKLSDEMMHVEAGWHTVKLELVGDIEPDIDWGTLVSMGRVLLEEEGANMGHGKTQVAESYDDENVLGATIRYGLALNDVVLFNRGTGTMTAGGLSSDGKQANVMGAYEGDVTEGFNVIGGTTLSFNDKVMFKADGAMNMAVDYRFGKVQVVNVELNEDELFEEDPDFNILKPITKLSTSSDAARVVSVVAAADAPYIVSLVEGEGESRVETVIESSVVDGMVTFTIPEGEHKIEILGTHNCVFDQHATKIPNIKTWANCTEGNVYYVSCYCGANGTETFTVGEAKGHKIVAVEAKEATETENGNIACWQCTVCKVYFADAEGKQQLKESDVIILALRQEKQDNTILIVCIVVGVLILAAAAAFLILKFKFGFFTRNTSEEEDTQEGESPTTEETPAEAPVEEEPNAGEATE